MVQVLRLAEARSLLQWITLRHQVISDSIVVQPCINVFHYIFYSNGNDFIQFVKAFHIDH